MAEIDTRSQLFGFAILSLFVTALVVSVGYCWWKSAYTTPTISNFQSGGIPAGNETRRLVKASEGFAGPAVGAGEPHCMSTSKDFAALYEMLHTRKIKTDEGPDDLRELHVLLSKLACMKRDLLGNAKVVQATRYQPFSTSHDIEPVAETVARCFSRTIPPRDLALSFDKWGSRGTSLIKRLCTALNLSDAEEKEALRLFGDGMADLTDIATGECCKKGQAVIGGVEGPRMVGGFTPAATQALREYKGYF